MTGLVDAFHESKDIMSISINDGDSEVHVVFILRKGSVPVETHSGTGAYTEYEFSSS